MQGSASQRLVWIWRGCNAERWHKPQQHAACLLPNLPAAVQLESLLRQLSGETITHAPSVLPGAAPDTYIVHPCHWEDLAGPPGVILP